jgi:hypothetical protein
VMRALARLHRHDATWGDSNLTSGAMGSRIFSPGISPL